MIELNAAARLMASHVITAKLYLWMHNTQTGVWDLQRDVTPETKDKWLEIFQKDKPHAKFVVSEKKPKPIKNERGEKS